MRTPETFEPAVRGRQVRSALIVLLAVVACSTAVTLRAQSPLTDGDGHKKRTPAQVDQAPLDSNEYQLRWERSQEHDAGILKHGGYAGDGASLLKRKYVAVSGNAQATVEIVAHRGEYSFTIHDFWATLLFVAKDPPQHGVHSGRDPSNGKPAATTGPVRPLQWESSGGVANKLVYVEKLDERGREGIVGWYSSDQRERTTVMVRYEDTVGLPAHLIDSLLVQYPSGIADTEPWLKGLEVREVSKWLNLLDHNRGAIKYIQMAHIRLRAITGRSFGLDRVMASRSDSDKFTDALNRTLGSLKSFVDEQVNPGSQQPREGREEEGSSK